MGGGCSRETHAEGGYSFYHKSAKSAFNAAANPMEHHASGGSTVNASFPYIKDTKMEMDGTALRTSSDCDGWGGNELDSIFMHTQNFTADRAVLYLTGPGRDGKQTMILTPNFGSWWKNVPVNQMNFFNNYYIYANHFAAEPTDDQVYIDKYIPTTTEHGLWDRDFVTKKNKIIDKYCPEADLNKSGWIRMGWYRFIYDRKAIEKLHTNHVMVNSPQFKGDWGKLVKKYCNADINNRIDDIVGKGTMKNANNETVGLSCLATDQNLGDAYCRGPKDGTDPGSNIEKTICRAYDDFELVASAYCKIDDNRKKQFCGCANAVDLDFCTNKGDQQSEYPGCAETEDLWKAIEGSLMERDRRFFKNRRKCHQNVCDSSRYQPTGWENGCNASYSVCTDNTKIKGDLIDSDYSVTQKCSFTDSGEMLFDGDIGKRTPEKIFIDDATKETKLFEKIFSVEGQKHDQWYEKRMFHILSSSSSCIIAILMAMGLIVI